MQSNYTRLGICLAVGWMLLDCHATCAEEPNFANLRGNQAIIEFPIGVTRLGTPISAFITHDDLDVASPKLRVLIVGGLDGSKRTTNTSINIMHRFYSLPEYSGLREKIALSVVPCGNPDGFASGLKESNASGGNPARGYPPQGDAYNSQTSPESQYVWRWIGMHAPDAVLEFLESPPEGEPLSFPGLEERPMDSLARQLTQTPACGIGTIEAAPVAIGAGNDTPFESLSKQLLDDPKILTDLRASLDEKKSSARYQLRSRHQRSALEIAKQLAAVYGHQLETAAYIPAIACLGRLRLAMLTKDEGTVEDLRKLTRDYLSGQQPTLNDRSTGSDFAGHILFGHLYDATRETGYRDLVLKAADRAFDGQGKPLEAMPTHLEMSDSVFMGCPVLAQAGRLTQNAKYFDMCVQHLKFMLKLNLRKDGLHRHSPLDQTAWGRGNGFPALGLALALEDLPIDHPGRDEVLVAFQSHLRALLPHQDATGAWHQVIDHPESYRELTCTCMITFAMVRGVRKGWLPEEPFAAAAKKGWSAIKLRIAPDGQLVDVCTGTGKQASLRDYLDRTAILGRDPRGGAMALMVATEMASWGE